MGRSTPHLRDSVRDGLILEALAGEGAFLDRRRRRRSVPVVGEEHLGELKAVGLHGMF